MNAHIKKKVIYLKTCEFNTSIKIGNNIFIMSVEVLLKHLTFNFDSINS
jgi:hypothetical protein